MTIEAVVFDIGGILEITPDLGWAPAWESRLGLAAGEIGERMADAWRGGEFDRKPAAWINVAAPGRGKGAEDSLMAVLGYVGADIVEAACRRIPVDRDAIGPDGTVIGLKFAVEIAEVWDALLAHLGKL